MSDKRFFTKVNRNGRNVIIDKECHIEIIDLTLACDVLNRLDLKLKTYNEQLGEQQATIRKLQDLCGESDSENAKLRIENKKLKEEIKLLKPTNVEQYEQIVQLQEENEQLRKTINEVIKLLVEEVDLFSDKATEHDIIAYKEMNQFDNKDAYYMCISTKKAIKMLQRCL